MQRHQRFAWRRAAGRLATADGWAPELNDVALTMAPKQYTIGGSRVRDRKVVGGFDWMDDIQWR
jgi:hypothetical protein